eukprot:maker-scaffold_3-snap-gene-5.7-mRNA-1 protein AED:0.00 eAED:0.00 QI:137/1/0.5/1/0/0.5/2/330/399
MKKKAKSVSSFQVFQQFITSDPKTGEETGERILSVACFKRWLSTREKKIVYPEESFRRTLVAHIRGADGRRPFSPKVEASLLSLLRGSEPKQNCWDKCFPTNVSRIGKRGFNKLGYHEAKSGLGTPETTKKKRKQKKNVPACQEMPEGSPTKEAEPKGESFALTELLSVHSFSKPPREVYSQDQEMVLRATDLVNFLYDLKQKYSPERFQPLEFNNAQLEPLYALVYTLTEAYSFDQLCDIEQATLTAGKSLLTPSAYYFLKEIPNPSDRRLSKSYLIPPTEQCYFSEGTVGRLLFRWRSWTIVDSDQNARNILKRNPNGCSYLELCDSLVELLFAVKDFLPILKKYGEVWFRARLAKGDGTTGIFLLKLAARDSEFEHIYLQDQTPEHSNLLELPFLL